MNGVLLVFGEHSGPKNVKSNERLMSKFSAVCFCMQLYEKSFCKESVCNHFDRNELQRLMRSSSLYFLRSFVLTPVGRGGMNVRNSVLSADEGPWDEALLTACAEAPFTVATAKFGPPPPPHPLQNLLGRDLLCCIFPSRTRFTDRKVKFRMWGSDIGGWFLLLRAVLLLQTRDWIGFAQSTILGSKAELHRRLHQSSAFLSYGV